MNSRIIKDSCSSLDSFSVRWDYDFESLHVCTLKGFKGLSFLDLSLQ